MHVQCASITTIRRGVAMKSYLTMTREDLVREKYELSEEYDRLKARELSLDMSRGKPGADQLDLSVDMIDKFNSSISLKDGNNFDLRNYGLPDGTNESRELFASLFDVPSSNVIVGGNSSLNMMFDVISQLISHGAPGGVPWSKLPKVKFLCPCPGYDRHFSICEYFGIEMIPVEMNDDGPDMKEIEKYLTDEAVKGMWCVPKYSNPDGITYSDKVVRKIANLKPKANDFRVMWDNSYAVHHLSDTSDTLANIFEYCNQSGNDDMVIAFASTSKITFPGSGIAAVAASPANIGWLRKRISIQTIGPDKLNQLMHTNTFKNAEDIDAHMEKHAEILKPKFKAVLDALEEISKICTWRVPNGGYFVSVNTLNGCAKRVEELCGDAGVKLTPAGATFPYGKDEKDKNIRIAPTFPPVKELEQAMELFCLCVKIATVEKMLNKLS